MTVTVTKNGVVMNCHSEEQLNAFLKAGYEVVEAKAEPPKKAPKKSTK